MTKRLPNFTYSEMKRPMASNMRKMERIVKLLGVNKLSVLSFFSCLFLKFGICDYYVFILRLLSIREPIRASWQHDEGLIIAR